MNIVKAQRGQRNAALAFGGSLAILIIRKNTLCLHSKRHNGSP